MTRVVVLGLTLAFIAGLAFLTVASVITHGLSAEAVVSVVVLVLLGVGIIGALSTPGD